MRGTRCERDENGAAKSNGWGRKNGWGKKNGVKRDAGIREAARQKKGVRMVGKHGMGRGGNMQWHVQGVSMDPP